MLLAMSQKPRPDSADPKADERGRYRVETEWISQATLMNVGLIVLGVYVLSALITVGATDVASRIAIVAWGVAMPLLAFISLITELQRNRRYVSYPLYFALAQTVGQGAAVIGFGATLWHVWYPAALAFAASSIAGLFLYQAYRRRLYRDNQPEPKHGERR
jgi:O-antigen/teichoic acid export membrane protein